MDDVDLPEDVDALLGEETPDGDNAWYLAREQRGDRPGYLQDVDRAWRRADAAAQAGGGRRPGGAAVPLRADPGLGGPGVARPAPRVAGPAGRERPLVDPARRGRHPSDPSWLDPDVGLDGTRSPPRRMRPVRTRSARPWTRRGSNAKPEDRALALAEVMPVLSPAERDAVLHEAVELVRQAMNGPGFEYWRQQSSDRARPPPGRLANAPTCSACWWTRLVI